MARAPQKITLSPSRDIPFDRLTLSQANVRKIKRGVSIGELAEDIARRTLLQSLNVRPVIDENGKETGHFEVPAGGRRFRALELLVRQKRLAKTAPVPCVVRAPSSAISAEEDSFAENIHREQLHPLDQFRAMQVMVEAGQDVETIAAAFLVTPAVVRQRLKLALVSPLLHELYVDDAMTLEQLMAFTVCEDHARQEQVWNELEHSYNRSPRLIRHKLTEDSVRVDDKRVRFVTLPAYLEEGGGVARDLFEDDGGGWLTDPALLDRLVAERLRVEAERIAMEGWNWVTSAVYLPWTFADGMREIEGTSLAMSEDEETRLATLRTEADALEAEWSDAPTIPEDIAARIDALDAEIGRLLDRPLTFDPQEVARAGAFVSIDHDGSLVVERGYVRPEDEPAPETAIDNDADAGADDRSEDRDDSARGSLPPSAASDDDEGDGVAPISDRLVAELTAWRSLALQDAVARAPAAAFTMVLHAVVLATFYPLSRDACLQLSLHPAAFSIAPEDLRDSRPAQAIADRHSEWKARLPSAAADVWNALLALDASAQADLLAHCASLAVNAQREIVPKYDNGRISAQMVEQRVAASHVVARAVGLDIVGAGWRPTAAGYFSHVTKARILADVADARGDGFADMIKGLKKPDMAREAALMLEHAGWLPEPLRTPELADTEPGLSSDQQSASVHSDDPHLRPVSAEAIEPESEADEFAVAAE